MIHPTPGIPSGGIEALRSTQSAPQQNQVKSDRDGDTDWSGGNTKVSISAAARVAASNETSPAGNLNQQGQAQFATNAAAAQLVNYYA